MLASDGRELPQEFMERVTSLEVVEQRLHWHSCANEDWRAAEDLGVTVNHRRLRGHDAARRSVKRHECAAGAEDQQLGLVKDVEKGA